MRVKCKVLVSKVGKGGEKSVVGCVAVGEKNGKVHMTVSTLKNKAGSSYLVTGNIIKIFDRFASKGKLTLRLREPAVDIFVSDGDSSEVQMLAKVLQAVFTGRELPKMSKLCPTKARHLKRPITNVRVTEMENYPFSEGFPISLVSLSVENCGLKRIDYRWFKLVNLVTLELPGNCLGEKRMEDFDVGPLGNLEELNLSNNRISNLPDSFWRCVSKKLTTLKLNSNILRELPKKIWQFSKLRILEVEDNLLENLPSDIGRCSSLQKLNASGNSIEAFPGSLMKLRLESIDLSGNQYGSLVSKSAELKALSDGKLLMEDDHGAVGKLFDLAGKCILDNKILTSTLPNGVRKYLEDEFEMCSLCRKVALPNSGKILCYFPLNRIASSVLSNLLDNKESVVLECSCCSSACSVQLRKSYRRVPL